MGGSSSGVFSNRFGEESLLLELESSPFGCESFSEKPSYGSVVRMIRICSGV